MYRLLQQFLNGSNQQAVREDGRSFSMMDSGGVSVNLMDSAVDSKPGQLPDILEQFASEVTDFSSEYSSLTSISYTAKNLAGPTSIYPNYGDFTQACVFRTYGPWWNNAPSSRKPFTRTPPAFRSQDYIELSFQTPVYPRELKIYETYHPGCLVRILACNREMGTDVDTGHSHSWTILWESCPEKAPLKSREFCPKLKPCSFRTDLIRLELCHDLAGYYTELDAVKLIGSRRPLHSLADSSIDPDGGVGSLTDTITGLEKLTLQGVSQTSPDTSDTHISDCHDSKGDNTGLLEAEKERVTVPGESDTLLTDNGHFDELPGEVIQLILSFLDHLSLCRAARTSSLLYKHCYDSLQYTELNLQPHWTQVTDHALDSMHSRCHHLQRLNLSWCHGNLISHDGFCRFIKACGKNLSCLYLSSCSFLRSDSIEEIVKHCPNLSELDLDSCKRVDSVGLLHLKNLVHLKRLNLYTTSVDYFTIIAIIRACSGLQYLNLGSCNRISSFDDVAIELSQNCKDLRSLDLWRIKTVTDISLQALANNCPLLEELELGWCSDLKSNSNCFVNLVQKCRKLKKLFLAANRTVCDNDLLAIARCCPDMEQLDILGTREVSREAARKVLESCPRLSMFDVSFCSGIDDDTVKEWSEEFPHVDIKKSFQN